MWIASTIMITWTAAIMLLAIYVDWIQAGTVKPHTGARVIRTAVAITLFALVHDIFACNTTWDIACWILPYKT